MRGEKQATISSVVSYVKFPRETLTWQWDVQEGDILIIMVSGIAKNFNEVAYARDLSHKLDITLGIHCPYYMDLTQGEEISFPSTEVLRWGGVIAHESIDPHITMLSSPGRGLG